MHRYFITLLLSIVLSSTLFSQTRLNLIDGRQLKLESYVFNLDEGYMTYSFKKKNGKLKNSFSNTSDIYSISIDGKDSIIYKQDFMEEFTVEDMGYVVKGRQYATKEYKPWLAFVSGVVVGCGTMFLPVNGMAKLFLPVGYTLGMAFVGPSNSYIAKRHENYADNDLFLYGYRSNGKKKIFKNTTLGVLGGIFMSGIVWSTIYLTR